MKKPEFVPKKSIDEYLDNKIDDWVIEHLEDKTSYWFNVFPPLEFLNLLYEIIEIIKENKNNQRAIKTYLEGLELNKKSRYFLLTTLIEKLSQEHSDDLAIQNCRKTIERLLKPLKEIQREYSSSFQILPPCVIVPSRIEVVKSALLELPNDFDKLNYLIEAEINRKEQLKNATPPNKQEDEDGLLVYVRSEIELIRSKLQRQGFDRGPEDSPSSNKPPIKFSKDIKPKLLEWFKNLTPKDRHTDLNTLINGGHISKKIRFESRQNRLALQFHLLRKNNKIDSTFSLCQTTDWLCENFIYFNNKNRDFQSLHHETVRRAISSGDGISEKNKADFFLVE